MAKEPEPFTGGKGLERAIEEGRDPNADLDATERDATKSEAAVGLAIAGASYTKIAQIVGYSSAYRARMAVERALANSAEAPEEREVKRNLIDKRLNRLLQSVMGKAVDVREKDHLAYNARALAIVDRQAKLWGVDAPTQVTITPTEDRISALVQHMLSLTGQDNNVVEADIIEADIMEEGN